MKNPKKNQVSGGALLSYFLIALNALYGFIIMPYIISKIGQAEYGVYKTITSVAASLMILDFGLGGTVMRFVAKYLTDDENHKIPAFIGMSIVQGFFLSLLVVFGSSLVYMSIDSIYRVGLTPSEIQVARQLFAFLSLSIICHIFENILSGIIMGYNQFIFVNSLRLYRLITRILLTYFFLAIYNNSLVLVLIDLFLILTIIFIEVLYVYKELKIKMVKFTWDWGIFWESFKYTILLFTTSVVAQVNNNLDNVIIGAIVNSVAVAIYSIALQFFNVFGQLSTSISGVMLPTIANSLKEDDIYMTNTRRIVIDVGRIQFQLLAAFLVGFVIFGKNFISIWLSPSGYYDIYYLSIILMTPALFELCVNVNISILRVKNILEFRTIVIVLSTLLNVLITIIGTYFWNYYAAAIGTALSFIIGNLVIMNIYYNRKFGFNMVDIYKQIVKRTWVCLFISGLLSYVISRHLEGDAVKLIYGLIIFSSVYLITIYIYGLSNKEKKRIKQIFSRETFG